MTTGNTQSPTVSVVIPAYRSPGYLNQALNSVRSQTFSDYEIIIVDDGSGDDCVSCYRLDDSIRLVRHPESRGSAAARNTGIREARGRYIALLDVDDVWLPDKLQTQVDALEQNPNVGLAFCHYVLVDERLTPLKRQPKPKKIGNSAFERLLAGNIIKSCSLVMIRREALDRCGAFDEGLTGTDDWDLWLRITHDYGLYSDPTPRVLYRVHPSQLSGNALVMRRGDVKTMEKWLLWARHQDHGVVGLVRRRLCHSLQRLAKLEARRGDLASAMGLLRRAVCVNPCDLRCYVRPVSFAFFAARARLFSGRLGTR